MGSRFDPALPKGEGRRMVGVDESAVSAVDVHCLEY